VKCARSGADAASWDNPTRRFRSATMRTSVVVLVGQAAEAGASGCGGGALNNSAPSCFDLACIADGRPGTAVVLETAETGAADAALDTAAGAAGTSDG